MDEHPQVASTTGRVGANRSTTMVGACNTVDTVLHAELWTMWEHRLALTFVLPYPKGILTLSFFFHFFESNINGYKPHTPYGRGSPSNAAT
jgi:hypothetical protein